MIQIVKTIPLHLETQYKNAGWEVDQRGFLKVVSSLTDFLSTAQVSIMVKKKVFSPMLDKYHGSRDIKERDQYEFVPEALFPGTILRPHGMYETLPIFDAVDFDEDALECGRVYALAAFYAFQAQFSMAKVYKVTEVTRFIGDGTIQLYLRIYGNFDTEEQKQEYINGIAKAYTLDGNALKNMKHDFWWDMENRVFMTFDKKFLYHLPQLLVNAFTVPETQLC